MVTPIRPTRQVESRKRSHTEETAEEEALQSPAKNGPQRAIAEVAFYFNGAGSADMPPVAPCAFNPMELFELQLRELIANFEVAIKDPNQLAASESAALFDFVQKRSPPQGILRTALNLLSSSEQSVVMITQKMQLYYAQKNALQGALNETANRADMLQELRDAQQFLQIALNRNWEDAFCAIVCLQVRQFRYQTPEYNQTLQNLPWTAIVEKRWINVFCQLLRMSPSDIKALLANDINFIAELNMWAEGGQFFSYLYQ